MPARPIPEMVLTEVTQLKALSDPLRLRLVEIMSEDAESRWAAKDLAARLETKQTKLYHHLTLLEEAGIIRVAETRMVSGIQERRYQAAARTFRVDRSLLTGEGSSGVAGVLDAVFDKARLEIMNAMDAGLIKLDEPRDDRHRMALWMSHARLSPASVRRVMRQIERLADLDAKDEPQGTDYGLVVGFYPRAAKDSDR